MCGIYYCITCMCKSHLHLVSFLFVPALYYTCKDSSPVPSTVCVSAPYSELHIPYCLGCGAKCGGVIVHKLWCVVV